MSFLALDLRQCLRALRKKPLFTLSASLIVSVGLGLTLYTYTLLSQLIFSPLLSADGTPLIAVEGEFHSAHGTGQRADPFHLNQIRDDSALLDSMSLYHSEVRTIGNLRNSAESRKVHLTYAEWNLFEVTGIQPILGRGFSPGDQAAGAESVIVLGYDIWQTQFGGARDIVGRIVQVEAIPKKVIGVMPEGFAFPATAQVWQNMQAKDIYPTQPSNRGGVFAVAKLKPSVSTTRFQQEIRAILATQFVSLPQAYAWRATSPGGYIRAFNFKLTEDIIEHHYPVFIAMLIVVLLILLLTCINVGNLLLTRVNERIKEVSIRIALGIPRKRLTLQMLLESILICSAGGVFAYALAYWGVQMTNQTFDRMFALDGARPFWWQLTLAQDALFVLLAASLLMVLLTGWLPARRALNHNVNDILRDGTRGAMGKRMGRASHALVVTEIALSCVVLVIATILLTTTHSAQQTDYGVKTQNRLTAKIRLAWGAYPWDAGSIEARQKRNRFYYGFKARLESLPNINKVGFFSSLPGTGGGSSHFEIRGNAADVFSENPMWNFEVVSRDAWSAVGIRLMEGRSFGPRDVGSDRVELADTPSPVIINAAMARDLFPNGDAIGQKVRTVNGEGFQTEWRTIIGIVSDTLHGASMQSTRARHTGYGLMDRRNWRLNIVLHYSGPQAQAEAVLQETLRDMNADATVHEIQSYERLIQQPMRLVNALNRVFLSCGLIALLLAASGIYAVSANSIALRSQEIATRRALGARDNQVIRLFLSRAGAQLATGLMAGVGLSFWVAGQISQSMILSISGYVAGMLGIPLFIAALVLLATYVPSRRAILQEPAMGLRG